MRKLELEYLIEFDYASFMRALSCEIDDTREMCLLYSGTAAGARNEIAPLRRNYSNLKICTTKKVQGMSEIGRKDRRRNGETDLFMSLRLLKCKKCVASLTVIAR